MLDFLTELAQEAGALALSHFGRLSADAVESKGHLDLVTVADRAVERHVVARLQARYPDDGIFGEEGSAVDGTSGRVWVIDPIDGTFNFVRGGAQWAVSIGLYEAGRPVLGVVHAPVMGMTLAGGASAWPTLNAKALAPLSSYDQRKASVGVGLGRAVPEADRLAMLRLLMCDARISFRCCNSATISMLEVATGEVDGYVGYGESSWDVMAAYPILVALGAGSTLDWSTTPLDAKLRFAIGKPGLLEAIAGLNHAG
ncbi:inositol monophosphatase [Aquibium carbonis]|uniref:Inositol-1-monophosphatase n=1 Tax=Aquibium carbonis TaxID=2495581 RepID=A0A429YR24_9HYPH|nr:inositol monophosphatase family protein [Aquibium carbonis]RST83871.1 inositol monophosphatase [Aquibium carbonis]